MIAVAVIPARGGSKRVPQKNIRLLGGKPAIAHTIQAALDSEVFESVVVSTDSQEIADIAREWGASVPFLRTADLADDHTPVSQATADAVRRLVDVGNRPDFVAQLMPNCPMRDAGDVRRSLAAFVASGAPAQISVSAYGWHNPLWALVVEEDSRFRPAFGDNLKARSQDLKELFCPTGAIWWARTDYLLRTETFYGPDTVAWTIGWDHSVDVDSPEDWRIAQLFMEVRKPQ